MIINLASHIITDILLSDFHEELKRTSELFAVSPIEDMKSFMPGWCHSLKVCVMSKEGLIIIYIRPSPLCDDTTIGYCLSNTAYLQNMLQLIFKKSITIQYEYSYIENPNDDIYKVITISLDANNQRSFTLYIPISFLRLISRSIDTKSTVDFIEMEIIQFFKNPLWLLPDLKLLIGMLSDYELSTLFHDLQNLNLITPYQLTLLLYAYPEMSFRLKTALSKYTINEVIESKKNLRSGSVLKRDIAGGVYAMEESIYFLLTRYHHFWFSSILHNIQKRINGFIITELLEIKDFNTWFAEMYNSGFLYTTLSMLNEITIAQAISADTDTFISIISAVVSKQKVREILQSADPSTTSDVRFKSRIEMIRAFRRIRMSKVSKSPDSLGCFLSRLHTPHDFNRLLLTVGWFLLSTSLKGLKYRTVQKVLSGVDFRPRLIIEDVLRGIVNPNILHDEIQIHKAQGICVKAIIQLYNDGIIDLE
jgi:hypothetical protein